MFSNKVYICPILLKFGTSIGGPKANLSIKKLGANLRYILRVIHDELTALRNE